MKLFATLIMLFVGQLVFSQSVKDLKWLAAKWERVNVKAGQTAFEVWEKTGKEQLSGQGITLRGTDTVFIEKLSILMKEGDLYYVAEVSQNQDPTYFKITSASKDGFTCENPEHDFPKKIVYRLSGKDLTAVISGNGKEMGFVFRRVD
ncbi:MAG: DUF6265 family protein [Cyclobacteriaceae bacterium]